MESSKFEVVPRRLGVGNQRLGVKYNILRTLVDDTLIGFVNKNVVGHFNQINDMHIDLFNNIYLECMCEKVW